GRTLGGATVATLQGVVVLLLAVVFGFRPEHWALVPALILVMLLVGLIFTALGTAIASKLEDMQGFQLIMNFLVMPIFFLSGALFPLNNLPKALAAVVRINPLTYGIDALRTLLIGSQHFSLRLDFTVLIILIAILISIGSYFFSKIQA